MTSLLKPKASALHFFNGFDEFGKIEAQEQVFTQKLDSIFSLPSPNLIKMDIQGAELTVLENGRSKLGDCLAIQLEVPYVCLYEHQPSFGTLDKWMRDQGYIPHCFVDIKRWSIAPVTFGGNFRVPGNQLLESDIIYIKDPLEINLLSESQLKKFFTLAHYCFKSFDLAVYILRELEHRSLLKEATHQQYLTSFHHISSHDERQ
jgi:hypothetical protein